MPENIFLKYGDFRLKVSYPLIKMGYMIKVMALTTTYLCVVLYTAGVCSRFTAAMAVCGILAAMPGVMMAARKIISGGM